MAEFILRLTLDSELRAKGTQGGTFGSKIKCDQMCLIMLN